MAYLVLNDSFTAEFRTEVYVLNILHLFITCDINKIKIILTSYI